MGLLTGVASFRTTVSVTSGASVRNSAFTTETAEVAASLPAVTSALHQESVVSSGSFQGKLVKSEATTTSLENQNRARK